MMLGLERLAVVVLAPVLAVQALAVRRRALVLPEAAGARRGVTVARVEAGGAEAGGAGTGGVEAGGVEAGGAGAGGAVLRLLILGDSSAAGVGVADQETALAGRLAAGVAARTGRAVHWQVIARTGATSGATLRRLAGTPAEPFDVAVIALGVNDVTHLVVLERWLEVLAALRGELAARFGVGLVVHSGLPPMGHFPALPQPLRWVMGRRAARFDAGLAQAVAGVAGVRHVGFDMPLTPQVMAADGFHPGAAGYALWAAGLAEVIAGEIGGA